MEDPMVIWTMMYGIHRYPSGFQSDEHHDGAPDLLTEDTPHSQARIWQDNM